jgi:tetratricopeptide (TPR) repeat protein
MFRDATHVSQRIAPYLVGVSLLVLPLVYHPGLGSSDLLPKRMILYAAGLGLSILGIWYWLSGQNLHMRSAIALPASAYVLVNISSLSWSTNPFSGLVEATQLTMLLILLLTVTQLIFPSGIRIWAQLSTLGALVLSLIGIAQFCGAQLGIPSVGLPSGTFVFRNLAASYLVGAFPLGLFVLLTDSDNRRRFFWGLSLAIMALFLVFTRTRGAWLGLALGFATAAIMAWAAGYGLYSLKSSLRSYLNSRHRVVGTCVCLVVFGAGLLLPNRSSKEVIQRFDEQKPTAAAAAASIIEPGSDRGRFAMWRHTLEMIADYPMFGVGLDNWEFIYPLYDKGDPEGKITGASEPVRPHNDYLWIASELGVVGVLSFLWLVFSAARLAGTALHSDDYYVRVLAVCSGMGLVALLGHGLFSFPKEQPATAGLFWIHLCALSVLSRERGSCQRTFWTIYLPAVLISGFAILLNLRHVAFDISFNRARAYAERQQWLPAGRLMDLALDQGAFDHRASFLKARYIQHALSPESAIVAYREALEFHPNYAHTHHNLGVLQAVTNAWGPAIDSYKRALEIRPGYTQARIHLGNAYIHTNQVEDAIREYKAVVDEWPDSPDALATLGTLLLQQGQLSAAVSRLRKATTLREGFVDALNNLGLAFEKSGALEEAADTYERVLQKWVGSPGDREDLRRHIDKLREKVNSGE